MTKRPYHVVISTPGNPASASVGTSGSSGVRFGLITASAFTLPPLMNAIADDVVSKSSWICPPTRSASACDEPLYGTCTAFVPAARLNASPARCCVLPTPDEPYEKPSGLAFISTMRSRTLFAATFGPTTSTFGTTTISATGIRSLFGS